MASVLVETEMNEITKNRMKMRDGSVLPVGCEVTWSGGVATVRSGNSVHRVSALGAAKALGITIPDYEDLEHWVCDSVCESVLGETVEPDGIDEHGSPSWLLAMGMV